MDESIGAGARRLVGATLVALAVVAGPGAAVAGEILAGPVPATVVDVIDGDTLVVRARIWLGQDVKVAVRLAGVDTPELRSACQAERAQARAARDFVTARAGGRRVELRQVKYGKFAGRVVASVHGAGFGDLGAALIAAGLGRAYDGGKRAAWCPEFAGRGCAADRPTRAGGSRRGR